MTQFNNAKFLAISVFLLSSSFAFSATTDIQLKSIEPRFTESSLLASGVDPLSELPVIEAKTRVLRKEANGTLTAVFGKITGANVDLVFLQDLMIYKFDTVSGKQEKVGAMMRIRADFRTKSGGMEISSVLSLAAHASEIQGTVQFLSYGITGKGVLTLVPLPPAGITESSLGDCLQALNVIRGKVGDPDVQIKPMVLPMFE